MARTDAEKRNFLNQYSEELEGVPDKFVSSKNKLQIIFDTLLSWRDDVDMPAQEKTDLIVNINQGKAVLQGMLDGIVNP